MKLTQIITTMCLFLFNGSDSVRLHKIFQFVDGYSSEHNNRGVLHIGNDYAIFLRTPRPHDKYLIYELYEAKNVPEPDSYKPKTLAISKVPLQYLREQLKVYRMELYKAKYVDDNIVPGTMVKTLREWQIDRALNFKNKTASIPDQIPLLRSIL